MTLALIIKTNSCCRHFGLWLKDSFHHTSRYTTLCWTSAVALLLNSLALFVVYLSSSDPRYWLLNSRTSVSEAYIIIIIFFLNLNGLGKCMHSTLPLYNLNLCYKNCKEVNL
jgi:hypothetical protein